MANSAEPARDSEIPPVVWMLPDRPGRGPRPSHSREQIAAAAIRIADAEGLDAVTMRRLAAEIGCGTMTLYRYVPTKDHLLDLMIDVTEGEVVFRTFRPGTGGPDCGRSPGCNATGCCGTPGWPRSKRDGPHSGRTACGTWSRGSACSTAWSWTSTRYWSSSVRCWPSSAARPSPNSPNRKPSAAPD